MTDDKDNQQPPEQEPTPGPPPEPAPEPTPRTRLRDRALGIRAVAVVALAGLILGGVGGAAIGVATGSSDGDDRQRPGFGQLPGGQQPPQGRPGLPPGAGVPSTPRQDGTQPDDPGGSTGDTGSNT